MLANVVVVWLLSPLLARVGSFKTSAKAQRVFRQSGQDRTPDVLTKPRCHVASSSIVLRSSSVLGANTAWRETKELDCLVVPLVVLKGQLNALHESTTAHRATTWFHTNPAR